MSNQYSPPNGPRVTRDDLRDVSRLSRVTQDRRIAGVAGGVARYFDIDPTVARVIFAVSGLFGVGLLAYAALWVLMPEDGSTARPLGLDDRNRGILLLGLAVLFVLGLLGSSWGWLDVPWPLIIIGGVVAFVLSRRERGSEEAAYRAGWQAAQGTPGNGTEPSNPTAGSWATGPATGPTGDSADVTGAATMPTRPLPRVGQVWNGTHWVAPQQAGAQPGATTTDFTDASQTSGSAGGGSWQYTGGPHGSGHYWVSNGNTAPRKKGPLLFWWTALVVIVVLSTMAVFGVTTASAYPAAALAIVAGALLLGAFWGRAGGLILIGLLIVPVLAVTTGIDKVSEGRSTWRPTTAAGVQDSYHRDLGRGVLDLSRVTNPRDLDGRTVKVSVNVGTLEVLLPANARWKVEGAVDLGHLELPDSDQGGADLQASLGNNPGGADTLFTIDASVDLGDLVVRRVTESADTSAPRTTEPTAPPTAQSTPTTQPTPNSQATPTATARVTEGAVR